MPQASSGNTIQSAAQIVDGTITGADLANDTITATQIAANAVGDSEVAAHTTTKITVPATLFTVASQVQGDIIYFNGTNWVRLAPGTSGFFLKTLGASANPLWAAASATYKVGATTRAGDTASGAQTIAHGLGATPAFVKIMAVKKGASNNQGEMFSIGAFDGTTTTHVDLGFGNADTATEETNTSDSTNIIKLSEPLTGGFQAATISIDATNITLTWTKSGTPNSATINILWEANT